MPVGSTIVIEVVSLSSGVVLYRSSHQSVAEEAGYIMSVDRSRTQQILQMDLWELLLS